MANNILSFEPTSATGPQAIALGSPFDERHSSRVATEKPLVPIESGWPPVKKKSYEIDTGIPPSRERSILLRPAELASRRLHQCILDTPIPSPKTASHSSNQPILIRAGYKPNRDQTYAMPYNNTAIPPPEEITGTASLPCQSSSSTSP